MSGERILVVDDEPQIRRALKTALEAHGFAVALAENGEQAIVHASTWNPSLVVLDIMLPDRTGFDVLRELRTWTQVPVIVLSARGQEGDKVQALDLGADDYLTKPFGIDELLARIRALIRRIVYLGSDSSIQVGDVRVEIDRHVVSKAGTEVHLTPREFDLLALLATNAGKVLTHRQILERVWGAYAADNAQQLRVYIGYLRRKLESNPNEPTLIVTEPGVGYRLRV